jgi:hypothetical protein
MTDPLSYQPQTNVEPGRASTHEQIYRILLGVFGGFVFASGGLVAVILRGASHPVPRVAIVIIACSYAGVSLCSFAVLALRILRPGRYRWVTLVWNIVMLFFIPLGTALGIYGLIVLDKPPIKPAIASV